MEAYQIIAGFSQIKSELRTKTRISKSMNELGLWFSFEEGILYVHDYADHEQCIAIAIYSRPQNNWRITLKQGTFGRKLIEWIVSKEEFGKIANKLNHEYVSYGFVPFPG